MSWMVYSLHPDMNDRAPILGSKNKHTQKKKNLLQLQFNPSRSNKEDSVNLRLLFPGNQMQLGAFKEPRDEYTD